MRLPGFFFGISLFIFGHLLTPRLQAQTTDSAYSTALRQYHAYLTPEAELYRGIEYLTYSDRLKEGNPYFEDNHMQQGTALYNGVLYENLPVLYDIVKDLLLVNDPSNNHRITLIGSQLDRFTIGRHLFVSVRDSLNPSAPSNGYYEQLHKGQITLLKKQIKTIRVETSIEEGIQRFIDSEVHYYIKKGDVYYTVFNRRSLLHALKDRSKDLKKFMKNNGLNIKKDRENTLLQVAAWYDGNGH